MARDEPTSKNSDEARRHTEGLIHAFVRPDRQARLLALSATSKGRRRLVAELAHFHALSPAVARPLSGPSSDPRIILEMLREEGAPATCYVISEAHEMDGKFLPLAKVISDIVGGGLGTLLSCIPGELGFFEGEGPSDRYILRRPQR
jgi:hypothetical protein